MSTTSKKRARQVKMRAVQPLLNNNSMVKEGEVFVFEGDELPREDIAVRVDADTPLGPQPKAESDLSEGAPAWTTPGFVKGQTLETGRRDDTDDLLD